MSKKKENEELSVLESSIFILLTSMVIFGILGVYYCYFNFLKGTLVLGISGGIVLSLTDWLYRHIRQKRHKPYDSNVLTMLLILLISLVVFGVFGAIGSIGFIQGASTNGLIVGVIICVVVLISDIYDKKAKSKEVTALANNTESQPTQAESEKKALNIHDLLPSFVDMDKDPTAEEIVRVAALTETILNLTFKNPFPIEQDPVFNAVLKTKTSSLMECMQSDNFIILPHEELKQSLESKYSEHIVKSIMEIDYWNQRMIEHVFWTKTLGPKPAFKCLQAALDLLLFAREPSAILIVNYAHLLLKFKMLKIENPASIEDIYSVLKQASAFLHYEEGMNYHPQGLGAATGNPLQDMINQINAQKNNS